jgi:hypothetical protein
LNQFKTNRGDINVISSIYICKQILSKVPILLYYEPLLLDSTVCLPLYAMWPSFGYFSTVI